MANRCCICNRKWPPEPVIIIILDKSWFEFCNECSDTPDVFVNEDTGESVTPRELYDRLCAELEEVTNATPTA